MSEQELDFSGLRDETVRELANLAARVAEGGVQELDFSGLGDDTLRVLANLGGIDEDVVGEDLTRDLRDVDSFDAFGDQGATGRHVTRPRHAAVDVA